MLGKYARVKVVMPIGSTDGTGYRYPLNYGTVYGEKDQTAYIMGIHHPVRNFDGRVIAVLRNKKEKKSIWIVAPKSTRFIVNDILEYLDPERDFPGYRLECLYESSCGAVIFHDIKGEVRYLLIKNKRSAHWGFPKGHIERGETKEQTALREVQEETGLRVKLIEGFSCLSKYRIRDRVEKTVTIFAATCKRKKLRTTFGSPMTGRCRCCGLTMTRVFSLPPTIFWTKTTLFNDGIHVC